MTVMAAFPALIWVAIRQLNGRARNGVLLAMISGVAVFVVSVLVPQPASLFAKVAFLAFFCLLAAAEGSRGFAGGCDLPGTGRRPHR